MKSAEERVARIILLVALGYVLILTAGAAFANWTAFLVREYTSASGAVKYCVYDVNGEEHIITIPAIQLCPLTLDLD